MTPLRHTRTGPIGATPHPKGSGTYRWEIPYPPTTPHVTSWTFVVDAEKWVGDTRLVPQDVFNFAKNGGQGEFMSGSSYWYVVRGTHPGSMDTQYTYGPVYVYRADSTVGTGAAPFGPPHAPQGGGVPHSGDDWLRIERATIPARALDVLDREMNAVPSIAVWFTVQHQGTWYGAKTFPGQPVYYRWTGSTLGAASSHGSHGGGREHGSAHDRDHGSHRGPIVGEARGPAILYQGSYGWVPVSATELPAGIAASLQAQIRIDSTWVTSRYGRTWYAAGRGSATNGYFAWSYYRFGDVGTGRPVMDETLGGCPLGVECAHDVTNASHGGTTGAAPGPASHQGIPPRDSQYGGYAHLNKTWQPLGYDPSVLPAGVSRMLLAKAEEKVAFLSQPLPTGWAYEINPSGEWRYALMVDQNGNYAYFRHSQAIGVEGPASGSGNLARLRSQVPISHGAEHWIEIPDHQVPYGVRHMFQPGSQWQTYRADKRWWATQSGRFYAWLIDGPAPGAGMHDVARTVARPGMGQAGVDNCCQTNSGDYWVAGAIFALATAVTGVAFVLNDKKKRH